MSTLALLMAAGGNNPLSYATWDPANKGVDVTLSGGNLTASSTYTVPGAHCVRANLGKTAGKWYWEITIGTVLAVFPMLGVARDAFAVTAADYPGVDANATGYYGGSGKKFNSGGSVAFGASYTTGNVISFALDATARTCQVFKNNVSQGVFPALGGTDAIYPCGIESSTVTANFGASSFVYSPPSGYNAGLYI